MATAVHWELRAQLVDIEKTTLQVTGVRRVGEEEEIGDPPELVFTEDQSQQWPMQELRIDLHSPPIAADAVALFNAVKAAWLAEKDRRQKTGAIQAAIDANVVPALEAWEGE